MGRRKNKQYAVEALEIVDTSVKGKGIGKVDGKVIFVDLAVPGDVCDVWVYGKEKKVPVANIQKMIAPSPHRIAPTCSHFGQCGGCKWQHLGYAQQLHYKEKYVRDAVERIGDLPIREMRPIIGCASDFNYRNKVEFTFSSKRWVPKEVLDSGEEIDWKPALGYHVAKFFDKVIDVDTCHLHRPIIDEIRNELRRFAHEQEYSFYDIRENVGFLRNIVFRTSEGTGELMLILIVGEEQAVEIDRIFQHLTSKFSEITSCLWIYNPKKNSSFNDLQPHPWSGPPVLTEYLGPWKYHISPTSFFQTNSHQAKVLYDQVRDFVGAEKLGTIYDLYCGAGSIGIYLNDLAEKIVGIEYVQSSVNDAYSNCALNGLDHLTFYAGDMKHLLTDELVSREGHPDLIVTDPPRAGMDEAVVRQLLKVAPDRIVYVSCNPGTQARDLAWLSEQYEVMALQPVDMFPQTAHVENIAYLIRKDLVDE